jgi:glycosyltransferase involved in cell wall biosynthesis
MPVSMNIILKGQLGFMNQYFEVIGITGYDEKHFNECHKREGIRMHAIEMARTISIIRDVISLVKLYWFFRKEKPSIVHTHTPKAGLLGMLAAWIARVPVRLHTVAGIPLLEVKGPKRFLLNVIEKLTYACAHKIYPNSNGLMQIITHYGFCPTEKLKVIANGGSNGINLDFYRPDYHTSGYQSHRDKLRSDHGIANTDIVFCFVGRIAKEKGIQELEEVFVQLQQMLLPVSIKLVLIGTFEKHYGVVDDALQLRIKSNKDILHLGRFDDVRPFYLMSDVYTFPSYREGFPNSVLEAGAMGLPCIVTNINGCNEIVIEDYNGSIIPVKDKLALKNAMLKMIQDSAYRHRLASHARTNIMTKYRREFIWDSLLMEYNSFFKPNAKR